MSKKNDSFPQKNDSPNAAPLTPDSQIDTFEQENLESRRRNSIFFNKTSLIGTGVLVIALVSVAIPYSLGWFAPMPVAETESEEVETPPIKTDLDVELAQSTPIKQVVSKIDDSQETVGFADYNESDLDLPNVVPLDTTDSAASLPKLDNDAAELQAIVQLSEESEIPLLAGMEAEEPMFDAEQVVNEFQDSSAPSLTAFEPIASQRETATASQTQTSELSNETEDVQDFATMALTEYMPESTKTPEVQAMIDPTAINTNPTHTEPTPLRQLNVAKHDPNPDTVHRIDENDYEQAQNSATFSAPQDQYAAQSFLDAADNLEQPEQISSSDSQQPAPSLLPKNEYQPKYAKIRQGSRALPNTHGQLWCEYDITPYTKAAGIQPGTLPEQMLVKWILRQTGEESWHSEPFGLLSATTDTLYVYHTPEMQQVIAEIVDRFVNPHGTADVYTFRIVSLNGPNWLTQFHGFLKPIRIDTAGAQGWLIAKEDYVRMIPELARRSDYKELCSPQFPISNGRQYVVSSSVPKNFTPNVLTKDDVWPGYTPEMSVINEGYSMSLIPLTGVDGVSADLMLKCESLQVEKMHAVALNVPSRATTRQKVTVESPQVSHFHLDEQIRWPKEKVLLLSLGTIPVPAAAQYNDAGKLIPEISRKISGSPAARGHLLLFVECKKQ